jgi:hypothetical protein
MGPIAVDVGKETVVMDNRHNHHPQWSCARDKNDNYAQVHHYCHKHYSYNSNNKRSGDIAAQS